MHFFALLLGAALLAQAQTKSGIDKEGMDTTCKPCDDFDRYASGTFVQKNPIPAKRSRWGTFEMLVDANDERLKTVLDASAAAKLPPSSDKAKAGAFYASCIDTAAIEKLGAQPLQPFLDRIRAARTRQDIRALWVSLQRDGFTLPPALSWEPDSKNPEDILSSIGRGGLSLPDRDYYLKDDENSKSIRAELGKHMDRMLALAGKSESDRASAAKAILEIENGLAKASMPLADLRDPYKTYNRVTFPALIRMAPGLDWAGLAAALNIPQSADVNVNDKGYLAEFSRLMNEAPVETWKPYIEWRVIKSMAPFLSKPFVDEDFYFDRTVLTGAKEQDPRWQTCAQLTDNFLGDALGQLYVEKYYPPRAKQRMDTMIENLRAALQDAVNEAGWMTPETKQQATEKLRTFMPKIGYPSKLKTYEAVAITPGRFALTTQSAAKAARARDLAKIGKPRDRADWLMTAPTVNAYYNPSENEIVFPAGILQLPFFDMDADDAANYGAIGAVIGHEMGHGFDDQGSKFDSLGRLRDWWTDADRKNFEDRAGCITDQFFNIDTGGGLKHNGKLVTGEALSDVGGLALAYRAYKKSLGGKPAPVIDGFTGDQRFFLAFARVWAGDIREAAKRQRLVVDPHPLAKWRAVGTLQNNEDFHRAFSCKRGDPMVREPKCKLW
jgi:predicted metalloendopeptidase